VKNRFAFVLLLIIVGVVVVFMWSNSRPQTATEANQTFTQSDCVPTFLDGGGPYYQPNAPFRSVLAPSDHNGEELIVSGRVLESDCKTPLSNVVLDIWQANETGNYDDEWYRGQVRTDENGNYTFTSVVPRGYGQGTGYRPPHIHFKVWRDGQLLITSQMFLPESRAQGIEEPYIMEVESNEENGVKVHLARHNIILP
jgi:protocatechuate 3,4-dioxygenase beta subunit